MNGLDDETHYFFFSQVLKIWYITSSGAMKIFLKVGFVRKSAGKSLKREVKSWLTLLFVLSFWNG
jgi:hypothetical protein